ADRDRVLDLIDSADVLLENFRVGKMESMGYGYEELSARNPRLIYCSLKGFLSGPYGDRADLDEVVQMLGGLAYMTGPPGQALRVRQTTGRGKLIHSAVFENNAFLVGTHMAQAQISREPPRPMPTRQATWVVYDIFRDIDDNQVFVAAVSDGQWRDLCAEFGLTGLATDPDFLTNQGRVDQRERIHRELQAVLPTLTLALVTDKCTILGPPVAPVNSPADLTSDPHLVASGAL